MLSGQVGFKPFQMFEALSAYRRRSLYLQPQEVSVLVFDEKVYLPLLSVAVMKQGIVLLLCIQNCRQLREDIRFKKLAVQIAVQPHPLVTPVQDGRHQP